MGCGACVSLSLQGTQSKQAYKQTTKNKGRHQRHAPAARPSPSSWRPPPSPPPRTPVSIIIWGGGGSSFFGGESVSQSICGRAWGRVDVRPDGFGLLDGWAYIRRVPSPPPYSHPFPLSSTNHTNTHSNEPTQPTNHHHHHHHRPPPTTPYHHPPPNQQIGDQTTNNINPKINDLQRPIDQPSTCLGALEGVLLQLLPVRLGLLQLRLALLRLLPRRLRRRLFIEKNITTLMWVRWCWVLGWLGCGGEARDTPIGTHKTTRPPPLFSSPPDPPNKDKGTCLGLLQGAAGGAGLDLGGVDRLHRRLLRRCINGMVYIRACEGGRWMVRSGVWWSEPQPVHRKEEVTTTRTHPWPS